jgi:hypothetical protein
MVGLSFDMDGLWFDIDGLYFGTSGHVENMTPLLTMPALAFTCQKLSTITTSGQPLCQRWQIANPWRPVPTARYNAGRRERDIEPRKVPGHGPVAGVFIP